MMARRGGQIGGAPRITRPRLGLRAMYEDFRPVSEWKHEEELNSHVLLIYLPGFSKEQIKVSTEGTNTLRIRGERLVGGNKWSRFEEDFRIPDDCNIRGIRAKFEGSSLIITMPKKVPITTTTQVSPKIEEPQKAQLEAPLLGPAKIEQERNEKRGTKESEVNLEKKKEPEVILEKKKESEVNLEKKKDKENVSIKKGEETTKDNEGKELFKPENYMEMIEEKVKGVTEFISLEKLKEKGKEISAKGKEITTKYEELKENISKKSKEENEGKEKVLIIPENNVENILQKGKEKEMEDFTQISKGPNIDEIAKEKREGKEKGKGSFRHENYIEKIEKKVKEGNEGEKGKEMEKYKQVIKGISKGDLKEERQLMVNVGVAVLVIMALGAHISYSLISKREG